MGWTRDATGTYRFSADIAWESPTLDEACRDANGISAADPEVTHSIYGDAHLARLADLKRTWDPDNAFRLNHNVAPAV